MISMYYKCKHFAITELVSNLTYKRLGDSSWRLFNYTVLQSLDKVREIFGKPIIINNWKSGGPWSQRGLRSNMDELVKKKTLSNSIYLSSHCFGYGFDINVKGMSGEQVFNYIIDNQDKFPFIVRMESRIDATTKKPRTWTHIEIGWRDPGVDIEVFSA